MLDLCSHMRLYVEDAEFNIGRDVDPEDAMPDPTDHV